MLFTALTALAMLLLIGPAFGAISVHLQRRGPHAVLVLWVLLATVLAVVGTARVAAQQKAFAYQPARTHPAWMAILFTIWFLITLAPAAKSLAWGHIRSSRSAAVHASVLVLPGFLFALLVGLALELAGINFLPTR